jgi:hypothetical protein
MAVDFLGTGTELDSDPYGFLFDEDKARKAASAVKLFQDVSVGSTIQKMKESGAQERETISRGAQEQRAGAEQAQRFAESDEARDYRQAQRAYRY